ncbi:MAG: heme o synthase [Infirmifilum sp.]
MKANFKEILVDFFKLKQSLLLLWTGVFAFIAGSNLRPDLPKLALTSMSMLLTIMGTTGINMVLDADIDALMFRTSRRPIPSGKLNKLEGSLLSLLATVGGLVLALSVNLWVFSAGLLGFLIDIILYTYLLKRRSPWSTVFGGFAGGMPALGGWAGATGSVDVQGVLLLLLVAVWSNLHIWTLATYYVDDYRRANVPMLPAIKGEKAGVLGSLAASLIIFSILAGMFVTGLLSIWGLAFSALPLIIAVYFLIRGLKDTSYRKWSYKAFKVVNMFMAIVFLALLLK